MKIHGYLLTKLILCICVLSELSYICSARRKDKHQKAGMPGKNGIADPRRRHSEKRNYPSEFPLNNIAEGGNDDDDMYDGMGPEDTINLSTNNEEVETPRRKRIDPKGSWISFVKFSKDRAGAKPADRRKNRRRRKQRSKTLHGPPGPAGPQGPPGPPGTSFTKEEILADLQELIKEAAEIRAKELLASMVQNDVNKTSIPVNDDVTSHLMAVPRIYAGFSMRLKSREIVQRKSLKELKLFQQPFGPGAFQRGDAFNTDEGRFVVPRDGVYQFTANLRLKVRSKKKSRIKTSEYVEVSICIDSMCKTNTSIATVTGITKHRTLFTVTVTGTLHLQEKQYISVYVDNASSCNIICLADSEYSGLFLGV